MRELEKRVPSVTGRKVALVVVSDHKEQIGSGVGDASEHACWFIDLTQT